MRTRLNRQERVLGRNASAPIHAIRSWVTERARVGGPGVVRVGLVFDGPVGGEVCRGLVAVGRVWPVALRLTALMLTGKDTCTELRSGRGNFCSYELHCSRGRGTMQSMAVDELG